MQTENFKPVLYKPKNGNLAVPRTLAEEDSYRPYFARTTSYTTGSLQGFVRKQEVACKAPE
jgi:hypothetical protein